MLDTYQKMIETNGWLGSFRALSSLNFFLQWNIRRVQGFELLNSFLHTYWLFEYIHTHTRGVITKEPNARQREREKHKAMCGFFFSYLSLLILSFFSLFFLASAKLHTRKCMVMKRERKQGKKAWLVIENEKRSFFCLCYFKSSIIFSFSFLCI